MAFACLQFKYKHDKNSPELLIANNFVLNQVLSAETLFSKKSVISIDNDVWKVGNARLEALPNNSKPLKRKKNSKNNVIIKYNIINHNEGFCELHIFESPNYYENATEQIYMTWIDVECSSDQQCTTYNYV